MSVTDALRKALDNISNENFKRFKHHAMEECKISRVKLEEADRDDTINVIIQNCTENRAGQIFIEILSKMCLNQNAEELMKELSQHSSTDVMNTTTTRASAATACQDGEEISVGRYGDVMKIETTGASAATARQDGNNEIIGKPASFELAETDLERMHEYKDTIIKVGRETGMDPAVIAGIISRASRAGSEYVMVDGWNANQDTFGLMQIAKQWHKLKGDWNSEDHIRQGTGILTSSVRDIKKRYPKWTKEQQLKGGIAAYCAGPQNVPADYEKVDENTFAKDYSNDVVARAQFYREQGFHL
ncbi:lysozyme g-like isoform X2 [Sardina pilchardus]|uniref:lysozyme g-like isoform X2 n=1 Tax=Sardina pilchardus TaxID=27697 RepID=UPI002E0DCEAC